VSLAFIFFFIFATFLPITDIATPSFHIFFALPLFFAAYCHAATLTMPRHFADAATPPCRHATAPLSPLPAPARHRQQATYAADAWLLRVYALSAIVLRLFSPCYAIAMPLCT